jgi:hypothetical protein
MVSNLFLAQAVTTMQALEVAIGHAIGIVIVIAYCYAIIVLISALLQERGDGTWKMGIIRAIGIFAAAGIVQILCTIFFPGLVITPSFA